MTVAPGQTIAGRYRLTRFIGGGGMGRVYMAQDLRLAQKTVAVKVLAPALLGSELNQELRQRFEREAQLSAILGGHPRIIQVTDYGIEQDQPYLVMEFLAGRNLGEVLRAEGPLTAPRVVQLALQIAGGLHYAHEMRTQLGERTVTGVIHRDIKPGNLLLVPEAALGETIKILDFGIAKALSAVTLGATTSFIGSLEYASPEQLRGEALDRRSDIYSLGLVLYELLSGERPLAVDTNTFPAWYQAHNFTPPRLLTTPLPAALVAVVMACLAKDPADRPADLQLVSTRLAASLGLTAPLPLPPGPVTTRTTDLLSFSTPTRSHPAAALAPTEVAPPVKRRPLGLRLGAAVLAAVGLGLAVPFLLPKSLLTVFKDVFPAVEKTPPAIQSLPTAERTAQEPTARPSPAPIEESPNRDPVPDAETQLRQAIERAPNQAEPYLQLALLLEQGGRSEEAHTQYELGIQLDPQASWARLNFARLLQKDDPAAARTQLEIARTQFTQAGNLDQVAEIDQLRQQIENTRTAMPGKTEEDTGQ
ncbi:serine/threonine-protein kinase [Candidatus Cyanaurora vandensis]|uniref:serine/threonine-protein kinase n=3 Tax=Candidatus Cyanaurora vandensis TaxID=2714958 RepID=UPI00257CB857|nr:serine/threonine-protein kinase [Candidatus Cyanaurora vandensis]